MKTERRDENKYNKQNPKYRSKNPGIELIRDTPTIQSSPTAGTIYDTEIES
jgi:hypothetical protein